jgi:Ca-activated chloride channel family protein
MRLVSLAVVAVGILLTGGGPAFAEYAEPTTKTLSPCFYVESGAEGRDDFPLKATAVKAVVSGVIADVRVTQTYANQGNRPINARYIFPASTRAAVHGMRMTVGEDVVVAHISERQAAKKEFTQARAAGKSASLLEQQRPNVFSMNVANIMPGDTVSIELHYSELLVPEEGVYQFVYPTVVGPRYSTIPEAGADDHHLWIENPYLTSDHAPTSELAIQVSLAAGLPIQQVACGSHAIDVAWEGDAKARIELAAEESHSGNRDFILEYRLSGDRIQTGLMLYQGEEENFFMLMVQPPRRVTPEVVPPREYIFVLDVSGSMYGFPLDTAKELMKKLLADLRPVDRFNVILFAGSARLLAPRSLPADATTVQAAVKLIDDQEGGGGTELAQALKTGMELPRDHDGARTVVLVTDGYIAAEKEVFSLIADHTGDCNVFAFGIGSSVNRHLIEGVARAGQGEPFVVTDPLGAAATAVRFKNYIEAPVLTGIDVDFGDFAAYDVEPGRPADLFAQRPLVLCGKWKGASAGTISITGTAGNGPYAETIDVAPDKSSDDHSALPFLWARTRLGRISDVAAVENDQETRDEVTQLGLRYNLLTAHTSFVAVHEVVRNTAGPAEDVNQPLPLPHQVSNLAVGTHNAPEPEMGFILAAMAAAAAIAVLRRRRLATTTPNKRNPTHAQPH